MMSWVIDNLGTIFVLSILIVIMGLIICSMIRNKKKGKSPCGCNCSTCPAGCTCHKNGHS